VKFEPPQASASTTLAALKALLLASQAKEMPPPATPASALKNKNKSHTPNTRLTLDLDVPSTPIETPIRLRSLQSQKRSKESEEIQNPGKKRRATTNAGQRRLASVHTTMLVDACGLSSPATNHQTAR